MATIIKTIKEIYKKKKDEKVAFKKSVKKHGAWMADSIRKDKKKAQKKMDKAYKKEFSKDTRKKVKAGLYTKSKIYRGGPNEKYAVDKRKKKKVDNPSSDSYKIEQGRKAAKSMGTIKGYAAGATAGSLVGRGLKSDKAKLTALVGGTVVGGAVGRYRAAKKYNKKKKK